MNLAAFHKTPKLSIWLAVFGITIATLGASAIDLEPYSLRVAWYIEDDGDPYWEVRVTCTDKRTYRYIVQRVEHGPWCAKQAPDVCHTNKVELAFKVCSKSFSPTATAKQEDTAPIEDDSAEKNRLREQLLAQKVALQQLRANLNRRKLEIQRKEQELNEREVSILERQSNLH